MPVWFAGIGSCSVGWSMVVTFVPVLLKMLIRRCFQSAVRPLKIRIPPKMHKQQGTRMGALLFV